MNTLKNQKQIPKLRLTQDTLATQNTLIIPYVLNRSKKKNKSTFSTKVMLKWLLQACLKITIKKLLEVVKDKKLLHQVCQKLYQKKSIVFCQKTLLPQKSEADLIFAWNKSLQKV